jgi:hypothetical protein
VYITLEVGWRCLPVSVCSCLYPVGVFVFSVCVVILTHVSLQVLEHIRLPLISPYYIHDVIESLEVVRESQRCQRLISEAKDYLLLQDRRGELYCPRARPRRSTGRYHTHGYMNIHTPNTPCHPNTHKHKNLNTHI